MYSFIDAKLVEAIQMFVLNDTQMTITRHKIKYVFVI